MFNSPLPAFLILLCISGLLQRLSAVASDFLEDNLRVDGEMNVSDVTYTIIWSAEKRLIGRNIEILKDGRTHCLIDIDNNSGINKCGQLDSKYVPRNSIVMKTDIKPSNGSTFGCIMTFHYEQFAFQLHSFIHFDGKGFISYPNKAIPFWQHGQHKQDKDTNAPTVQEINLLIIVASFGVLFVMLVLVLIMKFKLERRKRGYRQSESAAQTGTNRDDFV